MKLRPPALLLLVLLLSAVPGMASAQAPAETVGSWGDPRQIRFEGTAAFKPDAIRKALARDIQWFLAAHPSAALEDFAGITRQRIIDGYRHAGFGEVKAEVRLDQAAHQVVVEVDEGRQSVAADILLTGVNDPVRQMLLELLTARRPGENARTARLSDHGGVVEWMDAEGKAVADEKPLWVPGGPARMDEPTWERMRKQVQRALADLGYDQAEFATSILSGGLALQINGGEKSNLGVWQIQVTNLGPAAVVREIRVEGNEKNSPQEIVDFLALRTGTIATRELQEGIVRSLWNSGRFLRHDVRIDRDPGKDGVRLTIEVDEYADAPRLADNLSREESALLRHREWLVDGKGSRLDAVLSLENNGSRMEAVISPVAGILLSLWNDAKAPEGDAPDHALVAVDESFGCYALDQQKKLVLPTSQLQLQARLACTVDPEKESNPFTSTFSFGASTVDDDRPSRPLTLTTSSAPVFFVALAHEERECSWNGPVLTVKGKSGTLRIDERTGRLVESVSLDSERGGFSLRYEFRNGAFAARRQQILDEAQAAPSTFDPRQPLGSIGSFACTTGFLTSFAHLVYGDGIRVTADRESLAACGKWIERGGLAPAEVAVQKMLAQDNTGKFKLPYRDSNPRATGPLQAYGYLAAMAADCVFPRDTWAWTSWRETALTLAGGGKYTGQELNKLLADDRCGPSACWVLAEMLSRANLPAGPVAGKGLATLDAAAFSREWDAALHPDVADALNESLTALGTLDDDEVRAVARLWRCDPETLLRIAGDIRQGNSEGDTQALPIVLQRLWVSSLGKLVEQRLRALVKPAAVATRPAPAEVK